MSKLSVSVVLLSSIVVACGAGPSRVVSAPAAPPVLARADAPVEHASAAMRVPTLDTADGAIVELREALRARGMGLASTEGGMSALWRDPNRTIGSDEGDETYPRGAWLVQTGAGRWWVWGVATATPADDAARKADDCAAAARRVTL